MALIESEFISCEHCGNQDFRKDEIVGLPKNVKKRYNMEESNELPILNKRIIYVCTSCNKRLDK